MSKPKIPLSVWVACRTGGGKTAHVDRIQAVGYADRQKAESLALAGKIDVNINANKGQDHKTE